MEINYIAVLGCAVFAMALGALWYGPLFGKKWCEIIGADVNDLVARAEMQKKAMPLYLIQFLLTLFQVYVLVHFVKGWIEVSGVESALWIFFGFVMPTIAAGAMWNNDSRKIAWARFLIQGGYQFILFIVFGFVLGTWG